MSMNDLISKIEALNEWETLMNEAKAEAEALRDSIKAEMLERNTEELTAGAYIIRWTSVLTQRFDSTAFKKAHEDLYKDFTKQTARHPSTGSALLSMMSMSPSHTPSSIMESPFTLAKKVEEGFLTSSLLRSRATSMKSSAGDGNPAWTSASSGSLDMA